MSFLQRELRILEILKNNQCHVIPAIQYPTKNPTCIIMPALHNFKEGKKHTKLKAQYIIQQVATHIKCLLDQKLYYTDIKLQNTLYNCNKQQQIDIYLTDLGAAEKDEDKNNCVWTYSLPKTQDWSTKNNTWEKHKQEVMKKYGPNYIYAAIVFQLLVMYEQLLTGTYERILPDHYQNSDNFTFTQRDDNNPYDIFNMTVEAFFEIDPKQTDWKNWITTLSKLNTADYNNNECNESDLFLSQDWLNNLQITVLDDNTLIADGVETLTKNQKYQGSYGVITIYKNDKKDIQLAVKRFKMFSFKNEELNRLQEQLKTKINDDFRICMQKCETNDIKIEGLKKDMEEMKSFQLQRMNIPQKYIENASIASELLKTTAETFNKTIDKMIQGKSDATNTTINASSKPKTRKRDSSRKNLTPRKGAKGAKKPKKGTPIAKNLDQFRKLIKPAVQEPAAEPAAEPATKEPAAEPPAKKAKTAAEELAAFRKFVEAQQKGTKRTSDEAGNNESGRAAKKFLEELLLKLRL